MINLSWSDVSYIHVVGGTGQSIMIFLKRGLETNIRFYWDKVTKNYISIPLISKEHPQALIECIKQCSGDKFEGIESPLFRVFKHRLLQWF